MKNSPLTRITRLLAGTLAVASAQLVAQAQMSVQVPGNVVETGSNAWHYLVMEGESYIDASKQQSDPSQGFAKVYNDAAIIEPTYGTPILATNTGASMGGALLSQFITSAFNQWGDKVTYQVAFSTPGDYYLYMRFTMFENGGNTNHYINEDSFFLPPDFNKDPQFDWVPDWTVSGNGQDGGYCEGCCGGAGFLYILDYQGNGSRTDHHLEDTNYWEGNFHWNQCFSSQFLNPAIFTNADGSTQVGQPFHYKVTPAMVGVPQNFTIAYREGGGTYDLWLFSTHTNLLNDYMQSTLDQLFVSKVNVQDAGNAISTPSNSYPYLVMEGESFMAKSNHTAGFVAVAPGSTNVDYYINPILATNTTASGKGALFTSTAFAQWGDKVNYQVQFSSPGDYYLYMRFTMFENGGNTNHYINEDSFFVPPTFNKDPQFDWVPDWTAAGNGQDGGYCEGCCGGAGFLYIIDFQGNGSRTDHHLEETNYWEGVFHWNQCYSSQFLNPAIFTNADGSTQVGQPFHYVVTPAMVGVPQNFAVGYREGGGTYDLWLFCTHTNLLNEYPQDTLDRLILHPKLYVAQAGGNVVVSWQASLSFADFILESSSTLAPARWSTVQTPAVLSGTRYNLTLGPSGSQQYFRLREP